MENIEKPKKELPTNEQIDQASKEWSDAMKAVNDLKKLLTDTKIQINAARLRFQLANEAIRAFKIEE